MLQDKYDKVLQDKYDRWLQDNMTRSYRFNMTRCSRINMTRCYRINMTRCYRANMSRCYMVNMTKCYRITMTRCYRINMRILTIHTCVLFLVNIKILRISPFPSICKHAQPSGNGTHIYPFPQYSVISYLLTLHIQSTPNDTFCRPYSLLKQPHLFYCGKGAFTLGTLLLLFNEESENEVFSHHCG